MAHLQNLNILDVLMHSYITTEKHPRYTAPAVIEARAYLYHQGMIDRSDEMCRCTDKGEFFLKHLLLIPFPERTYFIPEKTNDGR